MSDFTYERNGTTMRIEDNPLDAYIAISNGRQTIDAVVLTAQRQAAAQVLAGDECRVVPVKDYEQPDRHPEIRERCPACNYEPDRPEPVDPASVKVGDIVDYERKPGYEACRIVGKVDQKSDFGYGISLRIHGLWWNTAPGMATVRVLQPAEPELEPDLERIEALRRAWKRALAALGSTGAEPNGALLYELTRHGVRVVSTNA